MRLKDYSEKDGKRVWLSEQEIQMLLANGDNNVETEIALTLMARAGLRRQEVVDVTFNDVLETETGATCRIWEGKGDKYREVPVPDDLLTRTETMLQMDDREPDDAIVTVAASTLYSWVQRAAERSHAETADAGWLEVGPHDLRRSWGVRLLEAGVLPSVVMEWGGWEDWETFRNHYLAEFSPEALRRERGKLSWLGGEPADRDAGGYAAVSTSRGGRR